MASPVILVVVIFLTVAGIAGLVIYLLSPGRERLLSDDDPPVNDTRISGQWAGGQGAGGDDTPTHHLSSHHNVIHHDFGGHSSGDGGSVH
jgi:hypothetical protein